MPGDINEKKKILLVDDDTMHLKTAELFLKNEYQIHLTKSGNEALDFINKKEFVPNLILLDILMPEMDGWEVFKRMKKIDFLKNVPIVFLTSLEDESDKKRAFQMGITDYILKPFNMTELKSRVKDIIEKK